MITQAEEPRKGVGLLHQQAIDIVTISTGTLAELEELEALFHQASGEEAELIGWEMEGWVVTHSDALIKAHDLSWLDS
ncbi:MAG: hypothetical protein KME47_25800 [Nodosilinea sp. WJT8-NPBG4]|jgi:hypothetical protein|nr:hypothetical protein [Nodosilinea sp. WJT8-NPBG4]